MNQTLSYKLLLPKEKLNYMTTNIVTISFLLLLSGFAFMQFLHMSYKEHIQEDIAQEIIRFHVIANSDSNIDQEIKMLIKNQLTDVLSPNLQYATNITDAREIIEENLSLLETVANQTLQEYGYNYTATASLEKGYFPLKVYGDLSLPPGEYEAIRVELGSAQGKNWWCIMFPPLCFVDSTYSIVPEDSKVMLKEVLTEDEYDYIFANSEVKVKVKFKLFDLLFHTKEKP